jgi:hypothetical protein
MNPASLLLAQANPPSTQDDVVGGLNIYNPEFLMVAAALGVVAFLLVLWALFYRKTPGQRHRRHHHHHRASRHWSPESGLSEDEEGDEDEDTDEDDQADAAEEGRLERRRRRRHRRRREHRPRNPTLAETGGLPPIRANKPPGPSPT